MSNQQAYLRFKELLESRQTTRDSDRDIRKHVLSLRRQKVGFGYIANTLRTLFGANIPRVFERAIAADDKQIADADAYFITGTVYSDPQKSHPGAVKVLNAAPSDKEIFLFEAGFLATTHSWSHSFRGGDPDHACLGYVYDDMAHYFMADYPNRLNQKLNSAETLTKNELARAGRLMARIVSQRISKYNAQPMIPPAMTEGYARRVLVCDQAFADASTIYGKVDEAAFERMLLAAIRENPDAEILVKTHPDSFWEKDKRTGYYAHLQSTGRVRVLRDPVNPYALFDLVDTVYVGTSQMGLEALFAGKKVVTFGAPFYAGWGLTDDRQKIPHRDRSRSLVEIFHYFYIWYTIYHLPGQTGPAKIEDVLSFIEAKRPYALPPSADQIAATPKISVIIPVHGVESYIEQCIASVQDQTLKEIEIIPVNDVSPDEAQRVIDRLASDDPRIRPIVLATNIKQGMARNRGIEAARGKYVWLLDGDDWLSHNDMLRQLYDLAEASDLDMLRSPKAHEAIFDAQDVLISEREDQTERYFPDAVLRSDFAGMPSLLHNRHCWTWLYRRDFLTENDIRFVTPQWEERAFLLRALAKARNIGVSQVPGPVYRIRVNSTARRARGPRDFEMMITNFRSTFGSLLEEGALDRTSPLRHHLTFQLSQFVQHMLISGPYRFYRDQGEAAEATFVAQLREEFLRCDFRPHDFVRAMHKLSGRHLDAGAYPLMIAAVLADRLDILRLAFEVAPVPQDLLYEVLLTPSADTATADLQAALSHYARNGRVQTAAPVAEAPGFPKPRVVIHIGATKTGSTLIQHMLDRNRPALLREGIWVPEIGLFWQPTRPHKQAGHSEFTKAVAQNDSSLREHIERGLQLMEGRVHTIVLSSEAFFLQANAHLLADYFEGYPVEMVVYLRRQDEWANSQYCEFVAGGAVGRVDIPIAEWLALPKTEGLLDYRRPLEAWASKIGKDRVSVRIFETAKFVRGDLLADFADATGLPQLLDLPRPDNRDQNEARLSAAHVELLRLYNKRPFASRDAYFDFIEEAGTEIMRWRRAYDLALPKPWVLSGDQAEALMERNAESNAVVASEYLGRNAPLFGPRGSAPKPTSLRQEEFGVIESIYARHAPPPQAKGQILPAPSPPPKTQPAPPPPPPPPPPPAPRLVNYGLFGWRMWLLTPILAVVYARIASPERFREFLADPFEFSRLHWITRHPLATWLIYPGGNVMGPFGIFRLWVPVARRMIRATGRADMRESFDRHPIVFARRLRSPLRRIFGRLMFPIGELQER